MSTGFFWRVGVIIGVRSVPKIPLFTALLAYPGILTFLFLSPHQFGTLVYPPRLPAHLPPSNVCQAVGLETFLVSSLQKERSHVSLPLPSFWVKLTLRQSSKPGRRLQKESGPSVLHR